MANLAPRRDDEEDISTVKGCQQNVADQATALHRLLQIITHLSRSPNPEQS